MRGFRWRLQLLCMSERSRSVRCGWRREYSILPTQPNLHALICGPQNHHQAELPSSRCVSQCLGHMTTSSSTVWSAHRLTGSGRGLNRTNTSIKPSDVCVCARVCVSKTNIKLDSLHPQKLEETSTDGLVPNLLGELDLCRHMCSPLR